MPLLLKLSLRSLLRRPGFAITAGLALSLGIGTTTVVTSLVRSTLLAPLPYSASERMVSVREILPTLAHIQPSLPANARHLRQWQEAATTFEYLVAARPATFLYMGSTGAERFSGARVSWDFLQALGVSPRLGRPFTKEEETQGQDNVILLSDAIWRAHFQADPGVVGRTLSFDNGSYTVVGVLPPKFRLPRHQELGALVDLGPRVDILKPLGLTAGEQSMMGEFKFAVMGVLRQGSSIQAASEQLLAVQKRISQQLAGQFNLDIKVVGLRDQMVGPVLPTMTLLVGGVALFMAIVTANLFMLILTRTMNQAHELAVQSALGARAGWLAERVLLEVLLLAGVGSVVGILFSTEVCRFLRVSGGTLIPRADEVSADWVTMLIAVGIAFATAMVAAAFPALRLAVSLPQQHLAGSARSSSQTRAQRRIGSTLIGCQVALTTSLLFVAGLLGASAHRVLRIDRGFHTSKALCLEFELPRSTYQEAQSRLSLLEGALAALQSVPSVEKAAFISALPLRGQADADTFGVENDTRPADQRPIANVRHISPEYFETLRIPLRDGRFLVSQDRNRNVAVVSARLAASLWPGERPIGKRIVRGDSGAQGLEVVGVVADVRSAGLEREAPLIVYLPYWMSPPLRGAFVVSTSVKPDTAASAIRGVIHQTEALAIVYMASLEELIADSSLSLRLKAMAIGAFAVGALLIVVVGIYGTVAYWTAQRSREITIREALGASTSRLRLLLLFQGLTPVIAGVTSGLVTGLAIASYIRAQLFLVDVGEPMVTGLVVLVIVASAAFGCYLPARRWTTSSLADRMRSA